MYTALRPLVVSIVIFCMAASVCAGKVVVAMNPLSVDEKTAFDGGAVSTVVEAELSVSDKFALVDREDMHKALKELNLSQHGMIAAESTRDLGKMVGANYFFSGSIKKSGDNVMVTVRVIEIETTLVKTDYTFIEPNGDVEAAGKKLAGQVMKVINAFQVDGAAAAEIAAAASVAKAIPAEWKKPTVMVVIPEMHVRQAQLIDPAGETEMVKRLIDAGFTVIDSEYLTMMKNDQATAKKTFSSPKTSTEFAAKKKVDVLLYGEAIAERGAALGEFVGGRGRIELKAIAVGNDEILVSDSAEGGATDTAETVAGKKAIKQAANKLADTFLYTLAERWSRN